MTNDKSLPTVFAVDIAGIPRLAFEAASLQEAQDITQEDWFLNDLRALQAGGSIAHDAKAPLQVRLASSAEVLKFRSEAPDVPNRGNIPLQYVGTLDSC
jgi:hypothetical protein